jgi:BMFP domain-containing protein YqiC
MKADPDPAKRAFVERLLADRDAVRRELDEAQREHWRQRVAEARSRVHSLEARLAGLEGSLTSDPLQRIERAKLRVELSDLRRHLAVATERWARAGEGGEQE